MQFNTDISQIDKITDKIIDMCKPGTVIALVGDLGAGKTTFAKALCKKLGYEGVVKSPSFSLVNRYPLHDRGISYVYHIDVYRLDGGYESVGIFDVLGDEDSLVVIEWADKIKNLLNKSNIIWVYFK